MGLSGGIIPAYAGSTEGAEAVRAGEPDHPRIRGEHSGQSMTLRPEYRIIPAYAGSTRKQH